MTFKPDAPQGLRWDEFAKKVKPSKFLPSPPKPSSASNYKPAAVPADIHQVYKVCLIAADQTLAESICQDPLPMLATIATILADEEEECQKRGVPPERLNKAQEALNFLTERVAALTQLVEPDAPPVSISSLYRDENGKRASRTMLMDVARGFARRVPMTKLIHMDSDIRPYLAALMIAALNYHGEILRIPDSLNFQVMPKD